jgi:hypothetical protein
MGLFSGTDPSRRDGIPVRPYHSQRVRKKVSYIALNPVVDYSPNVIVFLIYQSEVRFVRILLTLSSYLLNGFAYQTTVFLGLDIAYYKVVELPS